MIRRFVRKAIYRLKHGLLSVENVALLVAVLLCAMWTVQATVAMSRNWSLTEQLNLERKKLELLEIDVETAELENEYYKTEEYQELAARRHAGKQLPGENMVYLPEEHEPNHSEQADELVENTSREPSNFEKWLMYLFPNR